MPHNNKPADAIETETPRRAALKQMALLFGLSLSAQSLEALAANQNSVHSLTGFFTPDDLQMAGVIADLIIPTTETPGAIAANVHGFMDHYLATCATKETQQQMLNGLKKINTLSQKKFNKRFLNCAHLQRIQLLTALEKPDSGFSAEDKIFFKQFKSLTLFGYYTSEIGATRELAYLAIPGSYKGNFPFANVGKAWALN